VWCQPDLDPSDVKSFRPISNLGLTVLSKVSNTESERTDKVFYLVSLSEMFRVQYECMLLMFVVCILRLISLQGGSSLVQRTLEL